MGVCAPPSRRQRGARTGIGFRLLSAPSPAMSANEAPWPIKPGIGLRTLRIIIKIPLELFNQSAMDSTYTRHHRGTQGTQTSWGTQSTQVRTGAPAIECASGGSTAVPRSAAETAFTSFTRSGSELSWHSAAQLSAANVVRTDGRIAHCDCECPQRSDVRVCLACLMSRATSSKTAMSGANDGPLKNASNCHAPGCGFTVVLRVPLVPVVVPLRMWPGRAAKSASKSHTFVRLDSLRRLACVCAARTDRAPSHDTRDKPDRPGCQ